jgi:hypothetical protein
LQEEGYLELHENMIERGMGPFNLRNILSKMGLSKIQNLKHRYGTTKAQLLRKINGA